MPGFRHVALLPVDVGAQGYDFYHIPRAWYLYQVSLEEASRLTNTIPINKEARGYMHLERWGLSVVTFIIWWGRGDLNQGPRKLQRYARDYLVSM